MKDNLKFNEAFFELKALIKKELNINDTLTDEEIKSNLEFVIKAFEEEFENSYSSLFIYTYYNNLLNNTIDDIIYFTLNRKPMNNDGKGAILNQERNDMNTSLQMLGINYLNNSFVSKITNKTFNVNQAVNEIINNSDIFIRPPKGNPELLGPHATPTIVYDIDYWLQFKKNICKYINDFENSFDKETIKNYYTIVKLYDAFIEALDMCEILKGGKYVKN